MNVDKSDLLKTILNALEKTLKIAQSARQTAIDAATDEETVPEHKYDTLALEASYLAHGQSVRVQECERDIQTYQQLISNEVTQDSQAKLGSYVSLMDEIDQVHHFYVGPCAGGLHVVYQQQKITIITLEAPLGRALLGKTIDDEIELQLGDKLVCYDVIGII